MGCWLASEHQSMNSPCAFEQGKLEASSTARGWAAWWGSLAWLGCNGVEELSPDSPCHGTELVPRTRKTPLRIVTPPSCHRPDLCPRVGMWDVRNGAGCLEGAFPS